jgi:Ca2+-binding EF-hand superfamily protein
MALSADELRDLQDAFAYNDVDGDGRISFEEFESLLDELGAETSPREAHQGFRAIDTNGGGSIEFDEFLSWWTDR